MDTKFSDGQAGVDALTSSLNTRMHAQAAGQGTAGASLRQEGDALEQAVDVFYRRVMEDPSLEPFFREIDMERQRHKMASLQHPAPTDSAPGSRCDAGSLMSTGT